MSHLSTTPHTIGTPSHSSPYRRNLGQHCLFLLTPQGVVQRHGDDPWVQPLDGLNGELRDERIVEESMPTFLHLLQGEPAGEVHAKVDSTEVVGLLDRADEHQVVCRSPSTHVLHLRVGLHGSFASECFTRRGG